MSSDQILAASFWLAAGDDVKIDGTLAVGPGKAPEADLHGELTSGLVKKETRTHEDGTSVVVSGPADNETFTGPLLIHGMDSSDRPITMLDAVTVHRSINFFDQAATGHQRLRSSQAIIGGHLSGREHQFTGTRVSLQNLNLWAPLLERPDWGSEISLATGGCAVFETDADSRVWIKVKCLPSRNLRDLDRTILRPLMSLICLSTCRSCSLIRHQVQDADSGEWWDVYSASQVSDEEFGDSNYGLWLLTPSDLGLAQVKTWLDRVKQLGPLPPVVADLSQAKEISLETQVSQLTTIAEGLHRALFPEQRRMDDDSAAAVQAAAVAAAGAVRPGTEDAVKGLLNNLTDISYGKRIKYLAEYTADAVPGVTGRSIRKWVEMVYPARIDFAHRLRADFYEAEDVDSYITTALSLRWLLTGLLLLTSGFPAPLLTARFGTHEQYQIFLKYASLWKPEIYDPPA